MAGPRTNVDHTPTPTVTAALMVRSSRDPVRTRAAVAAIRKAPPNTVTMAPARRLAFDPESDKVSRSN